MFAPSRTRFQRSRRGIVLILILAMLSIMALIGVTFATISGQAQVGARFYAQAQNAPSPQAIFDYALEQIINDTNNPKSMIRGHSLLRDMYGHDGQNNKYLPRLPAPDGSPLLITNFNASGNVYTITTNIPTYNDTNAMQYMPTLYGMRFVGWTLRLQQWIFDTSGTPAYQQTPPITQTFQVTVDDDSGARHVLTLSPADVGNPRLVQPTTPGPTGLPAGYFAQNIFELDGRYQFAFNGLGMSHGVGAVRADRPNFLYNRPWDLSGNYDPNNVVSYGYNDPNWNISNSAFPSPALDEPYDAIDTNNMHLGLVNADASAVIPSFHRPSTIVYDPANALDPTANDWLNYPSTYPNAAYLNTARRAKFLRPRKVDHPASGDSFPDLIPDSATGKITYDVDSDGDGIPEAVWLDLGYPVQRDRTGKMYKPLFAITVIGLNGKLPLNTAGNLQRRDPTTGNRYGNPPNPPNPNALTTQLAGLPAQVPGDHASHIGYSPFEINPKFAFATSANDGLADLQRLLVGDADQPVPTVPGRYGELNAFKIINPTNGTPAPQLPQAGRSFQSNTYNSDYFDANYNSTDFFPPYIPDGMGGYTSFPELSDMLDANGGPLLPSERIRRFVTPLDTSGNGLVMEYDQTPTTTPSAARPIPNTAITFGLGFDGNGRSSFFQYFRPPGVPASAVVDSNGDGKVTDEDVTKNLVNKLHGYEYHRNPSGKTLSGTVYAREFMARAPFNFNPTTDPNLINKRFPTFDDGSQNSFGAGATSYDPGVLSQGMYPDGGLGLNEDFQIDLYKTTSYDELYTNGDLEWLYRHGDPDSSSLHSRLGSLVSTFNTDPHLRRLFTTDSWEPIRYALDPTNTNFFVAGNVPSVAQAGRKINLNFPLPPSNSPTEVTRLKWCHETYNMLKRVVYPKAGWPLPLPAPQTPLTPPPGMTSAEFALGLAEVGQYVVNIVDFRDPDATMTRFINPDLDVLPAETGTDANGDKSDFSPAGVQLNTTGTGTLVQWGMEYLPIAMNEVLAYQFTRRDINPPGGGTQDQETRRLFVEIVNLLTEDANGNVDTDGDGVPDGKGGKASHLDLKGWGFVITVDDPDLATNNPGITVPTTKERPNSVTGQLHPDTIKNYFHVIAGTNAAPLGLGNTVEPMDPDGLPDQGSGQKYYVLSNDLPSTNIPMLVSESKTNAPSQNGKIPDAVIADMPKLPKGMGDAIYIWVHLLRPANPNDPLSEKVVVDSFRVPYVEGGVQVDMAPKPQVLKSVPSKPIYSVGRSQPLRGGHAVPVVETDPMTPEDYVGYYGFGYSEQSSVGTHDSNNHGIFYADNPMGGYIPLTITTDFKHTLGDRNDDRENWDYLAFNDRDFAGVGELLMVPSSPPGLFTKQFAERAGLPNPTPDPMTGEREIFPDNDGNGTYDKKYPVVKPSNSLPDAPDLPEPHPYPYLPHKFYYGADTNGRPLRWYQMFELFEVPSPVLGAIGPVAQGDNGDWLRHDVKPGLLNLNLIYDEEVFFGLLDDVRLNRQPVADAALPHFVTAILPETHPTSPGAPSTSYAPSNRGYYDSVGMPIFGVAANGKMKAAFADFLKLRHGGSGFIGTTPGTTYGNAWPDKPFWGPSVLAPAIGLDIHDTVLRPARLEIAGTGEAVMPTQTEIPPRRLFQVPDYYDPADTFDKSVNSPASETGGFNNTLVGNDHPNLFNTNADIFLPGAFTTSTMPYGLGGGYIDDGMKKTNADRRRHPYWRSEMLQKVMNLTTTRTHQFAVWVTVGYFEVVQEGNPQILATPGADPMLAIDQLGKEIGKATGENVRQRMFFVIDRSIAEGFDPADPADFRDLVRFSRRIE